MRTSLRYCSVELISVDIELEPRNAAARNVFTGVGSVRETKYGMVSSRTSPMAALR